MPYQPGSRKIVYIAGPFRSVNADGKSNAWGVQCHVMNAMKVALEVWKLGAVALCPHSNSMFFQDADGCEDNVWLEGDLELVLRSDAMIMTEDWRRSSGATAEKAFAETHGIPVFESIAELEIWLEEFKFWNAVSSRILEAGL